MVTPWIPFPCTTGSATAASSSSAAPMPRRQLDFEIRVALYDGRQAVLIEAECRNVSTKRSPWKAWCQSARWPRHGGASTGPASRRS